MARSLKAYLLLHGADWISLLPREGDLLLIADGIWYRIKGMKYTIYVLLLRPRLATEAVILPPLILSGHEDLAGWMQAVATIPERIRRRIGAMVCDGGTALVHMTYRSRWLLQRCHFHLFAAIQNYVTTGPRSEQPAFARRVTHLVLQAVREPSAHRAHHALAELMRIRSASRSTGLRRVLRGLSLHLDEYRTYLTYPEWHLPATSNAAESCIQCLRDLMYQCRGFRTKERLELWLRARAAHQKTIRCRQKNQPI